MLEPGAVSVLDEVFVFRMAPEVVAVGNDGVVLGLDDWADNVDDEGSITLAEVLALGGLTVAEGARGGVSALVGTLGTGALALEASCSCG